MNSLGGDRVNKGILSKGMLLNVTTQGRGAILGQQGFGGGWKGPGQRVASEQGGEVKTAPRQPHLFVLIHQEPLIGWVRNTHTLVTYELRENKKLCAEMTQAHKNKKILI